MAGYLSGSDSPEIDEYIFSMQRDHVLSRMPEFRLMIDLLRDGIRLCTDFGAKQEKWKSLKLLERKNYLQALTWLLRDDNDQLYDFLTVAETIEINPDLLRRGILRLVGFTKDEMLEFLRVEIPILLHDLKNMKRGRPRLNKEAA